eukprot:TRINITY_DN371_c0_g1_i1.p1 TRINITY_DN371_c0_g1~~TRINITY_DN371_c0_g1_i1.p1  ORF type:complete len:502 (+),score=39.28 TRINITY_DN371_c0_g1_i1:65-1507(+)
MNAYSSFTSRNKQIVTCRVHIGHNTMGQRSLYSDYQTCNSRSGKLLGLNNKYQGRSYFIQCYANYRQIGETRRKVRFQAKAVDVKLEDLANKITTFGKVLGNVRTEGEHAGFMIGIYDMDTRKEPYSYMWVDISEVSDKEVIQDIKFESCVRLAGQLLSFQSLKASNIEIMDNPSDELIYVPKPKLQQSEQKTPTIAPVSIEDRMPNVKDTDIPQDKVELWEHMFANLDQYWDMRGEKEDNLKIPDFKHKTISNRGLWYDQYTPPEFLEKVQSGMVPPPYPGWSKLLDDPTKYWRTDPETKSKRPNVPDFYHKATGTPIWYNPQSHNEPIEKFMEFYTQVLNSQDDSQADVLPTDPWEDLLQHPENWSDLRANKVNPRAPDFRDNRYRNGLALWLDDAPQDVLDILESKGKELKFVKKRTKAELWEDLRDNEHDWIDNRQQKVMGMLKPNYPDFKSAKTGEGLWLSDTLPQWVVEKYLTE